MLHPFDPDCLGPLLSYTAAGGGVAYLLRTIWMFIRNWWLGACNCCDHECKP